MSKRAPVAITKARQQDSRRNTQNGARPKKAAAARAQPSSIPSQEAKPAKTAKVLKPSFNTDRPPKVTTPLKTATAGILKPSPNTNQSLKPVREPVKKRSALNRLATIDGIPSQSPQTCDIARAEQFEQQMQGCRAIEDTHTTPIDIKENREPRTCCKIAVQVEEQMRDYREVDDTETTTTDAEESENLEVQPMQLQIYKTNMGARNETSYGPEDGSAIVAALSLEEYYLSRGKMIPPAVRDFIGPVKINKVGDGRGRGLVLTRDVAAGDLLLICNHIAKVRKVKTEISSSVSLEPECYTASHHVLAEQLVGILSSQAWRSARNRALLSTLCSRGGEELPVPPMRLFQPDLTPRSTKETTPCNHARLCGLVQCNAFGHTHISKQNNNITRSWSCGLWTLPSFMNHSCIPNVATVLIGDAMMVVASRNLKCGDELTVAYFDIFRPLQERRLSMLHSWNFVCDCARCILEETLQETLMQITQAYVQREAEAALTVQYLRRHDHCVNKAWSPYSVIDLAQLAEYIEELLHRKCLSRERRNWIRASYLSAFLADGRRLMVDVRGLQEPRRRKFARKTHIQTALTAAKAVTPGHPQTLQIAAVVLKRAVQAYGPRSFLVEKARKRALGVCLRLFGRLREEVLECIVEAAADEVLVPCVVFLG